MIFNKGAKKIQWVPEEFNGKRIVSQQMMLRQLDIHMQKKEAESLCFTPYINIRSKSTEDLNARTKTVKLLRENVKNKFS